jgi:hypothetical protein
LVTILVDQNYIFSERFQKEMYSNIVIKMLVRKKLIVDFHFFQEFYPIVECPSKVLTINIWKARYLLLYPKASLNTF